MCDIKPDGLTVKRKSSLQFISRFPNLLAREISAYAETLASMLPGATGLKLRAFILRTKLASLGRSPVISVGVHILGPDSINIGDNFNCGRYCSLYADGNGHISIANYVALNSNVILNASIGGEIKLGNNVLVGPGVLMRTTDHAFTRTDIPISKQGHTPGKILIGDDVWVGGNATILGGSVINKGAIVAAGAVVTSEVPSYAVVGGVPARFIKWRDNIPDNSDGVFSDEPHV